MMYDEERLMARPKIAIVRDFLGAVNENPFILSRDRADLVEKLDDLALGVVGAAKKLSEITGVDAVGFEDNGGHDHLARGLIALSYVNDEAIDITLSNVFIKNCSLPYFKLREMEKDEASGGHVCPEKAKEAMVGLASLHMLVKSVPFVYEELSRAPAPIGAVA